MTPRRILSLPLAASAFAATACAGLLGIEGGILDTADGSTADALDTLPSCTPDVAEGVDDGAGIFVAHGPVGNDRGDCGDRANPCASVQFGINRATTIAGKTIVYVASGEYEESLKLAAGITVDGGWEIFNGTWARNCTATPNAAVIIRAPENADVTVLAEHEGQATIHLLTLRSKPTALPGETLYGVIARGATTNLRLEEVSLVVASGGDGNDGTGGPLGTPGSGGCPANDGGFGAPSTNSGAGADAGFFTEAGYVALPAVTIGGNGTGGLAGTAGTDGGCRTCFATCANGGIACSTTPGPSSCGTPGQAGCAGAGGIGGQPGGGGGSSVGVFAVGAKVVLLGAGIQVGSGGAGGSGGLGGDGGSGANGMSGSPGTTCAVDCTGAPLACAPTNGAGDPGGAGGRGGNGGAGARGGGGAGGYSYGIFAEGDADVTLGTGASVTHSPAGVSRGNGASGKAADRFP
jgi:hypothetical protein